MEPMKVSLCQGTVKEDSRHSEEGSQWAFCYFFFTLVQSVLGAFWESLDADATDDEGTVVYFSEGTSGGIPAYFWQFSDTLPALLGDPWLPQE